MKKPPFTTQSFSLKNILIGVVVIGVVGLIGYNVRDLLFGSPFSVSTAPDGATLTQPFLPISGSAAHAREITINGRPVSIDRKGNFTDGVLLSTGYNIVEVAVLDRFGKKKEQHYQVFVEPTTTTVAQTPVTTYQQ